MYSSQFTKVSKTTEQLLVEIMLRLSDLNPYVYHGPSKYGSIYVKFTDMRNLLHNQKAFKVQLIEVKYQ